MTSNPQKAIHDQSLQSRDDFWLQAARQISWHKQPTVAFGKSDRQNKEYVEKGGWFPNAEMNTCFNCLDRHVYAGLSPYSQPVTASPSTPHIAPDPFLSKRIAFHHVSPMSFQTNQYKAITYGEALEQVQTLAGVLQSKGVKKGDTVVIYSPMCPEAAFSMLACARIGAVHSVVFGGFASKELAKRIEDSGCTFVISASCGIEPKGPVEYKPLVDGALKISKHKPSKGLLFLKRHTIKGHTPPELAPDGGKGPGGIPEFDWETEMYLTRRGVGGRSKCWECVPVASEEPAYTLYTSGTTGAPKGVVRLTGGHAVSLRYSIEHVFGMQKDDIMLCGSDLGWVVGHSYILYGPLLLGASTVIFEGKPILPDAGILWRTISSLGVTHLFTAPTALRAVKGQDPEANLMRNPAVNLKTLRALFLAGERSEPQLVSSFARLLKELCAPNAVVIDNYWSTEIGNLITGLSLSTAHGHLVPRPGSAGLAMPGMDVRIVNDDGKEVKQGEMGSLVIKTPLAPSALGGLWKNPKGFHKAYMERFEGKGDWFETGDQAVVDEDGYITILARSDDIINVSAHRLSSNLIEQIVTDNANVIECCVVGAPDKMKGQAPFALLVPSASVVSTGQAASSSNDPKSREILAAINKHVREELGPIAQLSGLVLVSKLPKTRSGKTLRRSVRAMVENSAEGKKNGDVPVPPTVEDMDVINLCKEAIESHFNGSSSKL